MYRYKDRTATEYMREWRVKNPEKVRNIKLKNKYGISSDDYDAMWEAQGFHCAACPSVEKPSVDHDHLTLVVRGILCSKCNSILGYAADDPERLRKLADYLEQDRG